MLREDCLDLNCSALAASAAYAFENEDIQLPDPSLFNVAGLGDDFTSAERGFCNATTKEVPVRKEKFFFLL